MGYLKQDGCGAMGYLKQDGCGAMGYLNKMAVVPLVT